MSTPTCSAAHGQDTSSAPGDLAENELRFRPNHPCRVRNTPGADGIVTKRCSELPAALAVKGDEESDHDSPHQG